MSSTLTDVLTGFWKWLTPFEWWQGLIVLAVMLIIFKYFPLLWKAFRNLCLLVFNGAKSETLQYRMYWGLVNNVLSILLKNELRRSFKENGFDNLSGHEFASFVKDKSKTLHAMLRQHLMDLYPPDERKLFVSMEEIMDYLDKKESEYEDIIFEIFIEAKKFKRHEIETYKKIDINFGDEVERFVKKNKDMNCMNCLLVLFGKREIAENKKRNIKTLKSQMNFTEQKLIELHSDLMDFYSKKLNNNHK